MGKVISSEISDSRFQIPDFRFQIPDFRFKISDSRTCPAFAGFQISEIMIERFEDIDIWQDARELCRFIKGLCDNEKFAKDYILRNQILSSSGSIMDNIAEGFERGGNKELIQFLFISKGSCGETRSQIYRAFDFGYITKQECDRVVEMLLSISKKLSGFISYLKKSDYKGIKYKT